ncbi:MAG: hypothetical protein ACYDB3_06455, partial [Acidimicrobiales bacterium]
EPALVHSAVTAASSFPAPIGLPRVVYAPHEYGTSLNDASGDVADVGGPAQFAPDLTVTRLQAERMGAAWWIGEWGALNPSSTLSYHSADYVPDMLDAQDTAMAGSAYWSYTACCAWYQPELTRMSPFAVAGAPKSFSTGAHTLALTWTASAGTTLVSLPAGAQPVVTVVQGALTSSAVTDTDGRTVGVGGTVGALGGWLALTAPAGTLVSIEVDA